MALVVGVMVLLGGSSIAPDTGFSTGARGAPSAAAVERPSGPVPAAPLPVPVALTEATLGLRDGPVAVPLELRMPSLRISVDVLGVGITRRNVMDAPIGKAADPVWQKAFWYRGGAVPGAPSTAVMAGHVNDSLGRPATFAHIDELGPGDPIVVRDTRTELDIRFAVTGSRTYSLAETGHPDVLRQIYGTGPVAGTEAQPSNDGLSHLTLITCTGRFRNGTHDHRLVVFATRVA